MGGPHLQGWRPARGTGSEGANVWNGWGWEGRGGELASTHLHAPPTCLPTALSTSSRLPYPQPMDPRIHFALNCGAASCPPIRVYTPDRLEFGLEAAASAFCAGECLWLDAGSWKAEAGGWEWRVGAGAGVWLKAVVISFCAGAHSPHLLLRCPLLQAR